MNVATIVDNGASNELAELKRRQQATWASGDYALVGTTLQIVGETLAEAADVRAGCAGAGHHCLAGEAECRGRRPPDHSERIP
jgi:hypothetical protein